MVLPIHNTDNGVNGNSNDNINDNHNNDVNAYQPGIPAPVIRNLPNDVNVNPNRDLIQDLDGWLESNGLRSIDDVLGEESNQISGSVIQNEECRRLQEEERYAQSIHRQAFHQELLREQKERDEKKEIIRSLHDKTMDIRTRHDEMIYHIPMHSMAQVCDTIYTMVQNKSLWDANTEDDVKNSFLQLSLELYSKATVQEFVNLCLSYHHDSDDYEDENEHDNINMTNTIVGHENSTKNDTNKSNGTDDQSDHQTKSGISADCGSEAIKSPPSKSSSSIRTMLHKMTDDAIILDCCRIGHYFMATPIVDAIIQELLIPNIDTQNCFTLYRLAEELNLTHSTLLQRTLSHMIQTIGEYSDDGDDGDDDNNNNDSDQEEKEWNNDRYRQELNERLRTMKRALESSVHNDVGGGGGSPQLFFASVEEYLSIFAERVQYYRERLQEAKEYQKQQQEQQPSSSFFTIRGRVISSSYRDAEQKIKKQEQRVRTLEIAYAEQRAIFRSSSNSSNRSGGMDTEE